MHHSSPASPASPVFPPSVAQRIALGLAAPCVKPRAGDYSINRAFLGSSLHLYRAFLDEKGPKHRETLRYARQARDAARHVIAAVPGAV